MDWPSIAGALADTSGAPVVLLDTEGRVRLFNSAMERLHGWRREDVEGRPWDEIGAAPEVAATRPGWLARALRGELRTHKVDIVTRDSRRLSLTIDTAVVGRGGEQGLLLLVREVIPLDGPAGTSARDLDYRVQATASEFGKLKEVAWIGGLTSDSAGNCFAVLHKRESPCADCPALMPVTTPWPRVRVRREPPSSDRAEVVTAEPVDAATVRIRVRVINDRELIAINDARIAGISKRARLTERETAVFRHLLAGQSLDEIAALMSLSRRTVKFHQGNIFQKLGADSRIDLVRLAGV